MKKFGQREISRMAFDGENEKFFVLAESAEEMLKVLKEVREYLSPISTKIIKPMHSFSEITAMKEKIQSIIKKTEQQP